jgi:hypothetical protein
MSLRKLLAPAALAASLCLFANVAAAAPAGPAKDLLLRSQTSVAEPVHFRSFRHCHRRWGHRRCHGGYVYGYRPGVFIGFGSGRRHWGGGHRHHRFHGHRGMRY